MEDKVQHLLPLLPLHCSLTPFVSHFLYLLCPRGAATSGIAYAMCARGRHFEFAPPDKLNDSPAELQVVRFCAVCPPANTDSAASGAMAVLSCSCILPSSGADQILQSLHHHLGAGRRRSHSVRRPSDPLPPPPSSIRLTGLTHTHSFLPSFLPSPSVMAKNGNLRVGHGTGGAACQAGDGAAQRSAGRRDEVALSKRRRSSRL